MRNLYIFIFMTLPLFSLAQSVGVNDDGSVPHTGAILDVKSSDKGILIPRLETTAVTTPAEGMLIYQPSDQSFYYYKGMSWEKINAGSVAAASFETTSNNLIRSLGSNIESEDFIIGRITVPGNSNITDKFFHFDQSSGAFRGGKLDNSNAWSPINTGSNSFAYGLNVKADGPSAIALGQDIELYSGSTPFAIGIRDTVYASLGSGALGYENHVSGTIGNVAIGGKNLISADASEGAVALGFNNGIGGDKGAVAIGYYSQVTGSEGSVAIGKNVINNKDGAVIVGRNNTWSEYPSDLAFAVGVGNASYDPALPSNDGMVVRGNGNVGINSNFSDDMLEIKNKLNKPNEGIAIIGDELNQHVHMLMWNKNQGGQQYGLLSTGGSSALGQGKFIVRNLNKSQELLIIDSIGNVGLRNLDPNDDIHLNVLNTDSYGGVTVEGGTSTKETHIILDSENNSGKSYLIGSTGAGGTVPNGSFMVRDIGAGEERLVIDNSGNVGIGEDNPTFRLQLETSSGANDGIKVSGSPTTQHSQVRIENNASNGRHYNLFSTGGGSFFGDGKFIIRDATVGADRLTIGVTGNIGMGIPNPSEKLQLDGAIVLDESLANTPGAIQYKNNEFRGYDGSSWLTLGSSNGLSSLTDIDGDTQINLESSADDDIIRFKLDNTASLLFDRDAANSARISFLNNGSNLIISNKTDQALIHTNNILIGKNAGLNHSDSRNNVYIGVEAAESSQSESDVAIGFRAMKNSASLSGGNVAIGADAGRELSTGNQFGTTCIGANAGGGAYEAGVFVGYYAGVSNLAIGNVFVGMFSGRYNQSGGYNTFIGQYAGENNLNASHNTFIGDDAGRGNTSGEKNTFLGEDSGLGNTTGKQNTFIGQNAALLNTTGKYNTVLGADAGAVLASGDKNTFIGAFSGKGATAGHSNTMLGYDVFMPTGQSYTNASAFGAYSFLRGDHEITIGGTGVMDIGGFTSWSNLSDGRFKENIKTNVPGLDFIKRLRPVTYNLNTQAIEEHIGMPEEIKNQTDNQAGLVLKSQEIQTGFIAQEVAQAAEETSFNFSGVLTPDNDQDTYRLRYAEFVVPLVKAVQEQQELIETMQVEIESLKIEIAKR